MTDERIKKLAHLLVSYSTELKPGEKALIETFDLDPALASELIGEIYAAGGEPFVQIRDMRTQRALLKNCTPEQLRLMAEADNTIMSQMQAYIGVRGPANSYELSDVPADRMRDYQLYYSEPVHGQIRVPHTKWVVLRWPTPSMAQAASMSTEAFEDFYFDVCTMDYARMSKAMEPLQKLMERTDKVRIVSPGTDLTFSIKGMNAIICDGKLNIPDGEVFTAPVAGSMNGRITYNTVSVYQGKRYENICFEIEHGKIVRASGSDSAGINAILDTDEGARGFGEFAFGVNPYINNAMGDTLFDEKIAGSIHLTPGSCYDEAPNGNESAIHWDLVLIQTPAYGGGEIWFDDALIRKDGRFVLPELEPLNPENLM